jgi:hypothetical protein
MKQILLATVATVAMASAVNAADIGVEVGLDFAQSATDKIVAESTIDVTLGSPVGVASLGLTSNEGAVEVDSYSLGTTVSGVAVAFGDQGDILDGFEGKTEAVGGSTLANVDDAGESLRVAVAGVSTQIGLTDISEDITDVENIQATYSMATSGIEVGGGVDYNLNTEEFTLLSTAGYAYNGIGLGVTTTYQVEAEALGFEADVTAFGITGFLNGDKDDMLQNVGAGYYGAVNGMGYYAEGAYNIDTEEFTPAAGISFKF